MSDGLFADVPVVTRDQVEHAKPDPDLFVEAARRLGVAVTRKSPTSRTYARSRSIPARHTDNRGRGPLGARQC